MRHRFVRLLTAAGMVASGLALQVVGAPPAAAHTVAGPNMPSGYARFEHTATTLDNGKVLIVGGASKEDFTTFNTVLNVVGTSRIYNPNSGTAGAWEAAASVPTARSHHSATKLNDGTGRVLVVGGLNNSANSALASVVLYNPTTNSWAAKAPLTQGPEPTGCPNGPNPPPTTKGRYNHAAAALNDGRVLVVGGEDQAGCPMDKAEVYNPATNTWTPAPDLPPVFVAEHNFSGCGCRTKLTATTLASGRVLVAGGAGVVGTGAALRSTAIYEPSTNSWTTGPQMGTRRQLHTATKLSTANKVLVSGGWHREPPNEAPTNTAEVFDAGADTPGTVGTWAPTADMRDNCADAVTCGRMGHTATALADGRVFVAGGSVDTNSATDPARKNTITATTEIYNPGTNSWVNAPNLPSSRTRMFHTATLLPATGCGNVCSHVLVVGGAPNGQVYMGNFPPYFKINSALLTSDLFGPSGI